MKKRWMLLGIVGILVALGWLLHVSLGSSMQNSGLSADGVITVGVPALATDPASYRGELRVIGTVAGVHPKEQVFLLANLNCRKEVLAGDEAACMTLPVHWKGPMPALRSHLDVEGEIEGSRQKQIFVADAVRNVLPSPPSAGAKRTGPPQQDMPL